MNALANKTLNYDSNQGHCHQAIFLTVVHLSPSTFSMHGVTTCHIWGCGTLTFSLGMDAFWSWQIFYVNVILSVLVGTRAIKPTDS